MGAGGRGPHLASFTSPPGHFGLVPHHGGLWKEPPLLALPSLPPNQRGQRGAKFPPLQVPVIYLKIVANIWYNCRRKRSNKAARSSVSERAAWL